MRRMIMMAVCMAAGFAATAGEDVMLQTKGAAGVAAASLREDGRLTSDDGQRHCSFTAKGSVNVPGVSFDFACTATEETCKDAIQKALECAKLTVKIVRDQFKS